MEMLNFEWRGVEVLTRENHRIIFRQGDNYRIRVFVNHSGTDEITTTYIQWKETDTDTLNCKINRSNTLTKINEVYLNEALIWSAASNTALYFEIIK